MIFHQKTKPLNFQALTLLNNSLTSLEIPFEYGNGAYKVVTGQGSTQKRNVGPEDEVVICDTVMRGTVSNEKGGTVNTSCVTTAMFRAISVFLSMTRTIRATRPLTGSAPAMPTW